MKRFFTDDSLEDFLKQNADRFQMRPSDKVWKGISKNLKRRNRRIGLFTGFFVVAASLAGYLLHQLQPETAAADVAVAQESRRATDARMPAISGNTLAGTQQQTGAASSISNDGVVLHANSTQSENHVSPGATAATRTGKVVTMRPRNRRGAVAAAANTSTAGADYLDAESSATLAEIDRIYTDASLAEPAAIKAAMAANTARDSKTPQTKLLPAARLSFEFFVTPTLSYRSLTENKEFTDEVPQANADPNTFALYNVNDAVTHKPSIGLEVGVSAKYALARNLKVQGGLQFNVSRYSVQAFDNYAPQMATMAYNGGGSAQRTTQYSNLDGGGRKENLQNMYFQVSAPIGFEVKIAGNSRTQFGITSTIQPTYVLSDRVYMLSTDYKTYAEIPWLVRRFNVNTALSTYVGYTTGKLAWQVGPQVRYQLMSSFVNKYPVKENLFDFGLRVGVSLNRGKH
ncbi:MAG: hypothetical protein EOO15_01995 [Chitinophagaceae bacterium]|nr:MAG: hypothetical protein EOO15_01995 [Chitinophagaceae bacterium]